MKFYITKYALTGGITICEGEIVHTINPKMISVKYGSFNVHYHKPHWHESAGDALAQAELMRVAKLKSIEKSRKKLEAMKFTIAEETPSE